MSKKQVKSDKSSSSASHQTMQKSTTLNRKYVSRPKISVRPAIEEDIKEEAVAEVTEEILEQAEVEPEANPKVDPVEEPLRSILNTPPQAEIIPRVTKITISTPDDIAEAFSEPARSEAEEDTAPAPEESPDLPPETHPYQKIIEKVTISDKLAESGEEVPAPTPRELKNEAIKKSLAALEEQKEDAAVKKVIASEKKESKKESPAPLSETFKKEKRHSSVGKFIIAFATSAACVGILGYFVSINLPSISVRVAAMQTGIEASYPSFIPRDYQLAGVTAKDDNTISMSFTGNDDDQFTIVEEKSSWDSNALLNNYVKSEWGEDYTTVREQGVTIYIHNSDAAWVNGGILYKLNSSSGHLTKKQIKNIALSL